MFKYNKLSNYKGKLAVFGQVLCTKSGSVCKRDSTASDCSSPWSLDIFSFKKQLYKRLCPSVTRFSEIANSSKFNKIHDFSQLLAG